MRSRAHIFHDQSTEASLSRPDESRLGELAVREKRVLKVELVDAPLPEILDGGKYSQTGETQS